MKKHVATAVTVLQIAVENPEFLQPDGLFAELLPSLRTLCKMHRHIWCSRRSSQSVGDSMSSESGNDSGGSSGSETDLGREAVVGQPFSDTDSASDVGASSRDGCSGMKKKMLSKNFISELHVSAKAKPAKPKVLVNSRRVFKKMKSKFVAGGEYQFQTRLNITDGSHTMVAAVATQAISRGDIFVEGNVLQLREYTIVPYSPNDSPDSGILLAMLILDAEEVGSTSIIDPLPPGTMVAADYFGETGVPVPADMLVMTGGSDVAGSASSSTDRSSSGPTAAPDSSFAEQSTEPPAVTEADREGPTHLAPDGFCDGVLCSICGLRTSSCFLRRQEMPSLESIRSQCYFADKSVEQMDNKHKRFLLYWWWAVNVFAIRGKGMRSELPACIVRRIREMYPNPEGELILDSNYEPPYSAQCSVESKIMAQFIIK